MEAWPRQHVSPPPLAAWAGHQAAAQLRARLSTSPHGQPSRRPHPGLAAPAGVERALADAGPVALNARRRADAFFDAAADWVRQQLQDPARRDESLRLVPEVRRSAGFAPVADLAGDAVTALAALDLLLRRAVAAGRSTTRRGRARRARAAVSTRAARSRAASRNRGKGRRSGNGTSNGC